ncbi:hypothetical protein EVAR_72658_1, partial [Eumeta japonica]
MELQTRRLSLQNSNPSAASSSSSATSTTPTNLTSSSTPPHQLIPAQKLQQQLHHHQHHPPTPVAGHLQRVPSHHGIVHGPQPYLRQSPSPSHAHCNNSSCNNSRSPEEFSGSNEITSSTSPLPQSQQQAQTIIATVNHHNKLLPNCNIYGTGSNNNGSSGQQHNDLTGRIRISKNLINQNNIMRTPTPPPYPHQQ